MAVPEGLPDPSQVSSADAAARLAAAEAANLAWRTNTAPVLAQNVAPAGITQAEQADAAREAAKHAAAFRPAEYYGVDPSSLGNVPLSQIASRYGTGFADIVQGYYTQHPTAEAQAIKQQYATTRGGAIENPYDPNSALGIAWEVSRVTGGTGNITESLKAKAIEQTKPGLSPFGGMEYSAADRLRGEKMVAGLSTVTGMETVPIRDITSNAPTFQDTMKYNPYEERALRDVTTRAGYTPIGSLGDVTTQKAMKGYEVFAQTLGLQGVTVAPIDAMTGRTLERQRQMAWYTPGTKDEQFFGGELQKWIQNKVELPSAYHHIGMEAGVPIPANRWEYAGDLAVEFLKGEPHKASERFSPVSGEMAKELPGGEGLQEYQWKQAIRTETAPGSKIYETWYSAGVEKLIGAEGKYGPYGRLYGGPEYAGTEQRQVVTPAASDRLVGSKMVASTPTYGTTEAGALPTPFISTSAPSAATVAAQNEYQPSGFLGLGGLLPAMPSYEKTKAYSVDVMSRMVAAGPIGGLGIIAKEEFGAPVSTAAGVTSRQSSGLSEYTYKPEPIVVSGGLKETTKTKVFQLPTTRTTDITNLPESTTISGGNQTISALGDWLEGSRGSIDRTNVTAVKEYNAKADLFTKMQEQNPVIITTTGGTKATITETGGTRTLTTTTGESGSKVYATEWDRFVEGSGRVARYVTGMPLAKQEAYFETIKNEQGIVGEAKRGLFFVGTTIINKPAELAPAAVLGFGIRQAAAMAPGFLGEVAAGSGLTARAAQFLQTPGGVSLAKAGMLAGFGGAYVYDVTDKLTATAEKTKENIYRSIPALAAMYAGGGGVDWVGETKIVNRVDVSTGTTFKGVQIYDTVFGGGKTPNGGGYAVGAYSPTESYTFPVKPPASPTTGGATVPTPAGQLKLPSGSGGYGAETYPSSFEGPVRDYSKMDLSGGARPFSMKTAPEMQAASTAKFRDTSGAAQPFSIKTQAETAARPAVEPVVSQLVGDFSGKAQPFTMKTDAEVKAGYWDVAEPIQRGDISGRGSKISLTTEREYLSGLPRDVSGKGEPFAARTQEEIFSVWEQERAAKEQGVANVKWVEGVISGKDISPKEQGISTIFEPLVETKGGSKTPFVVIPMAPKAQAAPAEETPKYGLGHLGYAEPRAPFSIPGVSEAAISAELAGMHPALRELALGATAPTYAEGFGPIHESVITRSKVETGIGQPERGFLYDIQTGSLVGTVTGESAGGISGQAKASMLQDVFASKKQYGSKGFAYYHTHPDTGLAEYDTVKSVPSKLDITRRHEWRRIVKREGVISSGNVVEWQPTALPPHRTKTIDRLSTSLETFIQAGTKYGLKPSVVLFTPPEQSAKVTRDTPSVVPYKTTTPREISVTTTRQTPTVVPYRITTPREGAITTTSTRGQETPWARTTEKPSPTKTITPIPPVPVPPLTGMFTWPGGTSGSTPGRKPRRAAFMETFMMGLDVGFGMGGRRPRAKSYTTPKKYKTKAPAAKKKGGKK